MSDTAIFIFGMFVFAVAIASSLISVIGVSAGAIRSGPRRPTPEKDEFEGTGDVPGVSLAPESL